MWKIKTKFILSAIFGLGVAVFVGIAINFYTSNVAIPYWTLILGGLCFVLSIISGCVDTPAEKLFDALTHRESEKIRKQKDIEYYKMELEEVTIQEKIQKKKKNISSLS